MSNRIRELRDRAILYIYEHGAGKPYWSVKTEEVQAAIGATKDELNKVCMMLVSQELFSPGGPIDSIGLNGAGQREAERLGPRVRFSAVSEPVQPISVSGTGAGSVVQINTGAGASLTATAHSADDHARLAAVGAVRDALPGLGMESNHRAEAEQHLDTLEEAVKKKRLAVMKPLADALAEGLRAFGGQTGVQLAERIASVFTGG